MVHYRIFKPNRLPGLPYQCRSSIPQPKRPYTRYYFPFQFPFPLLLFTHSHPTNKVQPNTNIHTGIIGLGNIGYLVAQKAYAAFGMKILYNDVIQKTKEQETSLNAEFVPDLNTMLSRSDCVVLATPASPSGSQLIDTSRLQHFKMGSR